MILQALKDYYDRKAADPESGIASFGWERREIPFLIVLDGEGRLVNVEDTREKVGKKLRARTFAVPQAVKRTGNIEPYFLWDNIEYVTGIVCKEGGNPDRVARQHEAFMDRLRPFAAVPEIGAVMKFLSASDMPSQLETHESWKEARQVCAFVAFKFAGMEGTIFDVPAVKEIVNRLADESDAGVVGVDLVSGTRGPVALLHPALKGIPGANTTGANIVSFNFPAATSFGKAQGNNSPVGVRSAFEYTTALNALLSKDSKQKLMVGDATVVFWAGKDDPFEAAMSGFFSEPSKDDPDRLVENVAALLKSPQAGSASFSEDQATFFVLGLSPNAARIAIRFWHVGTVAEMAGRFRAYFDDLLIAHGPKDRDHLSLWRLLVSTAVQGKSENIAPNLAGNVMRSILEGLPFPETLLQTAVMRFKRCTEEDDYKRYAYPRAKLIKGCLNSKLKTDNLNQERMLTVSLDHQNMNIGYRLGRLFAVLERLQNMAAGRDLNSTIKDKSYSAASSTPSAVFGNLMRISSYHLAKLKKVKPGYAVNLDRLISEVLTDVSSFPSHLSLDDQGRFAIGYYHQRQDFFTRKEAE